MKVLMINKFLFPNGGSETYIFNLAEALRMQGHDVEFFGMEHENRCVGNRVEAYTSKMDFHNQKNKISRMTYPFKIIYSREARKKIREVLEDFQPDVCHLNNFNYQLTPSVILEIVKWRRKEKRKCNIVFTAHDYQLLCPNHMMNNPITHKNCEKCLTGNFYSCLQGKCIHASKIRSLIGMMEGYFWRILKVYRYIDTVICCSNFMKMKMDCNSIFVSKTIAIHNFIEPKEVKEVDKKNYILYFGRYSEEKGIRTLIQVCKELPDIQFVFAGAGPLEKELASVPNIQNLRFQTGEKLENLIREAKISVYPSEWYENCPFSVMESQLYGTPVIASNIGGIPELIDINKTGEVFESGNAEELKNRIINLWNDQNKLNQYIENCKYKKFITVDEYLKKLITIYEK